jgi:hypothetical protein
VGEAGLDFIDRHRHLTEESREGRSSRELSWWVVAVGLPHPSSSLPLSFAKRTPGAVTRGTGTPAVRCKVR